MAVGHDLRVAERQHWGMMPAGLMQSSHVQPQPSFKAASHQPKSDAIESGARSSQDSLEYQRDLYERTIPLWGAMLKRMGTSCASANDVSHESREEGPDRGEESGAATHGGGSDPHHH